MTCIDRSRNQSKNEKRWTFKLPGKGQEARSISNQGRENESSKMLEVRIFYLGKQTDQSDPEQSQKRSPAE